MVTVTLGGGTGRKVIVHMSLAFVQSSVQNVMLFCKKRFMIFKINLVNLKKKKEVGFTKEIESLKKTQNKMKQEIKT